MSTSKTAAQRDKEITRATIKLFWQGMLQSPATVALCLLYLPAFFLLNVFIPLQVAYGLQDIFARQFNNLNEHLYLIAGAGIIQIITMGLAAWAHNRNGLIACTYVQRRAFENFLSKDYEFYSNQYIGSLGEQASALRSAMSTYSQLMFNKLFKHVAVVIGGVTVVLIQAPILAVIILLCMFAVLGYTVLSSRLRLRYRRDVSQAGSELAGVLGDALGHGTTVKSFAAEEYEVNRLNKGLKNWTKAQLKSWDLFIPVNTGRTAINVLVLMALLYATAQMYQDNVISVAIVILVQLYMVRLLATIIEIADFVKEYDHIMGEAYQAIKTMSIPQTIKDKSDTIPFPEKLKTISFKSLSFSYNDANYALNNIDFALRAGQKIGLVGYSGSGKTTLSKLLVRFLDPTNGSINVNGTDLRDMRQRDIRAHIAYVPQEPLLFHRSIYENIAYGRPDATEDEVLSAAKLANVDEFVTDLPKGYKTLVGERGIKLSGGQRQRVAIARAILKDAPILVLDEATSALDSKSEHLIQKALWNLMKGKTALVIAHRLSTIQRMDEIVVLDKGSVAEKGSHEELIKQNGIYAQLWNHQSGGYITFNDKES